MVFDEDDGFDTDGTTPKYKVEDLPDEYKALLKIFITYVKYEKEVNNPNLRDDWSLFDCKKSIDVVLITRDVIIVDVVDVLKHTAFSCTVQDYFVKSSDQNALSQLKNENYDMIILLIKKQNFCHHLSVN
jgi:hypothetical protein